MTFNEQPHDEPGPDAGPAQESIPATEMFDATVRAAAVEQFGSNGAWLLLSLVWYGWRVHYDLACSTVRGGLPEKGDDPRPDEVGVEFLIARDLQVQAALYASAEQFATLLFAIRKHQTGTSNFFDAYVEPPPLRTLVNGLKSVTVEELRSFLGDPEAPPRRRLGGEGAVDLDPASVEVTEVGGLVVPTSIIERMADESMRERANELLELVVDNVRQLLGLVEPPAGIEGLTPQPLRNIDNAFRHGFRVLFRQAVPEERRFTVFGHSGGADHAEGMEVDLFMPGSRAPGGPQVIEFGTVECTPERTLGHLEALRELCTRTGQVARAFLGQQTIGAPDMLLTSTVVALPSVPGLANQSAGR